MPNKKQLNSACRAALIIEARAGLIPASENIENELLARTARIGHIVKVYAKLVHGTDDLAITDVLTDLRHYCDRKGLAFRELDTAANEHHLEDAAESGLISGPRRDGDWEAVQAILAKNRLRKSTS